MPQLLPIPVVHHGARHFHIILISSREQGIGVLLELLRAGHELGLGKVEQGIAVIEERGRGNDLVRGVVDQEAEVTEVPVGIVDDGVGHDHIPQDLEVFRTLFLRTLRDGLFVLTHVPVCHAVHFAASGCRSSIECRAFANHATGHPLHSAHPL